MFYRRPLARRCRAWLLAPAVLLASCGGAASVAPASPSAAPAKASPSSAASASASAAASSKPSAAASASAAAAASSKLTIAYSNTQGDFLSAWVAKDAGIFQKNGLNVDLQLIAGGSKTMAALLSNQVQAGIIGGGEIVSATAGGADLVILATPSPVFPYKFEGAKDVKSVADLKGRKVGVASIGGSADIATRVVLRKAGLDPEKDLTIVSLSDAQTRSTALLGGVVDAGMDSPPGTMKLEAAGLHTLVDLAAEKIPAANDAVVVQRAWLNANRPTAQKIIDSLVQATARAKTDKPFTVGVLKKYYKNTDDAQMNASYDFYTKEVMPALPDPKPEQFKDSIDQLSLKNDKLKGFDITKILDDSFVQDAAKRGLDKG